MNLLNCEKEPIHIPGRIQSHGFLLAFSRDSYIIRYASANTETYSGIGISALLGQNFWDFLTHAANVTVSDIQLELQARLSQNLNVKDYLPVEMKFGGSFQLVFCTSNDLLIAEFEVMPSHHRLDAGNTESFAKMLSFDVVEKAADFLCDRIRKFSQFDRVMVYRFDEDNNGSVVAESGNVFSHSLLHHHFPASDVPYPARELYLKNRMRLIRDVNDPGVPIVTAPGVDMPLDLTWSILRSVSPIHIRYLKNMGVGASYSISIVHEERLWGLVTCHNLTARHIPLPVRNFCKTITDIFAANLGNLHIINRNRQASQFASALAEATTQVLLTGDTRSVLDKKLNGASGTAYVTGDDIHVHGEVPSDETIRQIADFVINQGQEIYHAASLRKAIPGVNETEERIASGLLALLLSESNREVLMYFKPEVPSTIQWAGNPEKVYADFQGMEVLNPRNSFDTWSQNFSGMSEGWNAGELQIAETLSAEILKINKERSDAIKKLHEKLQEAYEELSTFSYTVSHDLKTPLTAVKNYAQLLITKESLTATGEKFTGKIISSANKMRDFIDDLFSYTKIGFADPVWQTVNLEEVVNVIIEDFHAVYGNKFEVEISSLPVLQTDPTLIYQVFANLIGNAIKYSMRKDHPFVTVAGQEDDDCFRFTIRDNGIGMPQGEIEHLFTRFYRLSNARPFEGTGLGLAITKRIIEKLHGSIAITSQEGVGTECSITLPKSRSQRNCAE